MLSSPNTMRSMIMTAAAPTRAASAASAIEAVRTRCPCASSSALISVAMSFSSSTSRMVWGRVGAFFVNDLLPCVIASGGHSRRRRLWPRFRRILHKTLDGRNHRWIGMPDLRNDFIRRPAAAERLVERHKTVAGQPHHFGALLLEGELLP